MPGENLASLDLLRTFAIFAVILIHVKPFWQRNDASIASLSILINQGMRFAVPCFFLMMGYLLWPPRLVVSSAIHQLSWRLFFMRSASCMATMHGCCLLIIALNEPNLGEGSILAYLGRYTLGVYAIHVLVMDTIHPFWPIDSGVLSLLFPVLIYMVSITLVVSLAKLSLLRPFLK